FLLAMQYPNGCLPQIYPLEGSYHDAATFNDNAMVNALVVLRGVGAGKYAEATPSILARTDTAQHDECVHHRVVVEGGRVVVAPFQRIDLGQAPVRILHREQEVDAATNRLLVARIAMQRILPREKVDLRRRLIIVDGRDPLPIRALGEIAFARLARVLREVDVLRPTAVRRLE